MAKRQIRAAGLDWEVHLTLDRFEALKDADFVTTQFRVGLLNARVKDERIPLSHGVLGQETNGAGGIFKAFRTIPIIGQIIADMKVQCPDAWLINFTNPAGIGTSGDIASYAARQFANLGLNAFHIQDANYPFHLMTTSFKRFVIIVCSVTGETRGMINKVEAMKNLNSKIISITNTSHNTLAKLSDVNLAYHLTEEIVDPNHHINITSQIPAVFLLETLARRTYDYRNQ